MNEFHFLRPYFFLLLIPLLLLLVLFLRRKRDSEIWNKICSKDLIPYIVVRKGKRNYFFYSLMLATILLLVTALAGPTWQQVSQPLIKSKSGLVIALDLSVSMDAQDIKPSRLQRAIFKLNDLLSLRQEGQTALIVFSEEPFVVTPLTDDVATIKALLPALETKIMPSEGHQVPKAITKASELLSQAGISNGSILLVTSELSNQELEQSITLAKQNGTKISVLGVGNEEGTPIPKQDGGFVTDTKGALIISALAKGNLNRLAHDTQGSYVTLSIDDSDIRELSRVNLFGQTNLTEQSELQHSKWHDQGYLLVLLALPFAALYFRRGVFVVVLFLMPHGAHAQSWSELWKTPDQQAEELFHKQEYQQARDKFQNSDWQAASNYKLGDFKTAGDIYQQNQTPDGYYNYGTAKAKQGDFEEALTAYNKALELQPKHEDALYNKKLIEEFQKQQQQQNSNNQDKNKDDDKDNQNQQQDNKQDSGDDQKQDSQSQQNDQKTADQQESDEMDEKQKEELQNQYKEEVEKELGEEKESPEEVAQEDESQEEEDPQRQIDNKWLQRVKDDPGGLLRRKFLQQYQRRTNQG